MFDMYSRLQQSYYGKQNEPAVNKSSFIAHMPLIVIDCSKQKESLKNAPVDVKVKLNAKDIFPTNTSVYCLIFHDRFVEYNLISGDVRVVV